MSSRLLRRFTLTSSNNGLRVTTDPSGSPTSATVSVAAGDYYLSSDSFIAALNTALTATGISAAINGDTSSISASYPEGRLQFTHATLEFDINWSHGDSTLDPGLLGYAAGHSSDAGSMASEIWVPYQSRSTWYPQRVAAQQRKKKFKDKLTTFTRAGYSTTTTWRTGDYKYSFRWEVVPEGFASEEGVADSAIATAALLTAGDPWAPWECFWDDLDDDVDLEDQPIVFTPDITAPATFFGPFLPRPGEYVYTEPLQTPPAVEVEGKRWYLTLGAIDVRS